MQTAVPDPVRSPAQVLVGWLRPARQLAEMGVRLEYGSVPPTKVGRYDWVTATLYIRETAPIEDQVWLLERAWLYMTQGPDAAPEARPRTVLRLVPTQRPAPTEQTA